MEKEANEKKLKNLIERQAECNSIKANNLRDIEVKSGGWTNKKFFLLTKLSSKQMMRNTKNKLDENIGCLREKRMAFTRTGGKEIRPITCHSSI